MSEYDPAAENVWRLLEELYQDAANQQAKAKYAGSSDAEKRAILVEFATRQAATSKRWAAILRDLPPADPIG